MFTTLYVGFQMVTIFPAPLADPTSSVTRDHPREESERVGKKTRAADQLVHIELNLSNILAFIERRLEFLRCYRNKKNALMQ